MKLIKEMSFTSGWVEKTILSIFSVWMFLILLGALNDTNLNPWGLSSYIVGIGLVFLIYFIIKNTKLSIVIKKYQKILIIILIILALTWQILMVLKLSSEIGWDVGSIHTSLTNESIRNLYLSQNPNNGFLFYFQHLIFKFLNITNPTWVDANIINLILLDLSFIFNAISIRLVKKEALKPLLMLQVIMMITFVQVIVPYSDVMVLPFVSLSLLGFIISKKFTKTSYRFIGVLILSISSLGSYLMKPSAVIPTIAIIIWAVLHFIKGNLNKGRIINYVLATIIFLLILIGGISSFNHFEYSNNNITHLKKDMGEPMNHFIAMGLTAPGSWNAEQVAATNGMKTVQERSKYSEEIIKQRLKDNGILGMIQYFIAKNYYNTNDGTFGWYRGDGPYIDKQSQNKMQQIYYNSGRHFHDYQFVTQIVYIFLIITLLLGFLNITEFSQILRVSLIGGLTFLLIFEGGRSRYLIQFLPLIIMLFSLNFKYSVIKMKNIIKSIR